MQARSGIEIVTFGCRLNNVESDAMRQAAAAAGHEDLIVLNTCAVTAEAVRQARQTIRRLKRERPRTPIVVTGCAAQIEPATFAAMEEVAVVLGNRDKMRLETWAGLRGELAESAESRPRMHVGDIMARYGGPERSAGASIVPQGRTRAFVAVQNGCDHRCTFCIIPFGRGPSRSAPMTEVVRQVRGLVAGGHLEVVLTGVDLTSYGADLAGAPRLGMLVKEVLRQVPDLARLRLSSLDCIEADADLLDAMAGEARLMPHLHLSLQSGDDLILKRMKRRHSRADAVRFCEKVRALRPDVVFGADIIAGFPTETDAMFERSLELVAACGLTHLHVFPYSPRQGTPAARMPPVEGGLIKERARRLREAGAAALARHLAAQKGRHLRVLIETNSLGRAEDFTPVRLSAGRSGRITEVTVAGHDGEALIAA
ncbi:MAG: tRNA (N(6)-L-threonylcarbamoyladenosine(37)-C(2))-methylthiotransferase MtaB [Methylobacteriaceae bacterium]|nr:tRNA (N(6)-L-threonylcarbamoyladenosine(37)-C(2))-methylthiotransferase MtaB [Methylobacteriaceae bacterium]